MWRGKLWAWLSIAPGSFQFIKIMTPEERKRCPFPASVYKSDRDGSLLVWLKSHTDQSICDQMNRALWPKLISWGLRGSVQ